MLTCTYISKGKFALVEKPKPVVVAKKTTTSTKYASTGSVNTSLTTSLPATLFGYY